MFVANKKCQNKRNFACRSLPNLLEPDFCDFTEPSLCEPRKPPQVEASTQTSQDLIEDFYVILKPRQPILRHQLTRDSGVDSDNNALPTKHKVNGSKTGRKEDESSPETMQPCFDSDFNQKSSDLVNLELEPEIFASTRDNSVDQDCSYAINQGESEDVVGSANIKRLQFKSNLKKQREF